MQGLCSWQWCTRLDTSVGTPKLVHSPYPWFQEETFPLSRYALPIASPREGLSLSPIPERDAVLILDPRERHSPYPQSQRYPGSQSYSMVFLWGWEHLLLLLHNRPGKVWDRKLCVTRPGPNPAGYNLKSVLINAELAILVLGRCITFIRFKILTGAWEWGLMILQVDEYTYLVLVLCTGNTLKLLQHQFW